MICVLGPTASGKTRYAVDLALRLGGEIISADSRQVYRGMDIGTGKDLADYNIDGTSIPYHLIDIVEAGSKYDLHRYQRDFAAAYLDITSRGKFPILCGGTGLYIEAVTKGYSIPDVAPDHQLRAELEKLETEKLIEMFESLTTPHNITEYDSRQRLIRAIEIAKYRNEHPEDEGIYSNPDKNSIPKFKEGDVKFIGLSVSRETRNAKIDKRLDERLEAGMVDEVKGLLDRGIPAENLLWYGLEYKFITKYLLGELIYDQMKEKLAIAIHQFAKRQMTWFRGMERRGTTIEWVDPLI